MNGAEIRAFTASADGLIGHTLEETFFYNLLNIAKAKIEAERAWRVLIKEDTSNSVATSNVFTTAHDLPTRFAVEKNILLIDSNNSPTGLSPVPFESKYTYKDSPRRYYIDIANGKIYITGSIGKAYTLVIFYAEYTADIDADVEWSFPARFHTILGFLLSEMYKGGVDYDDVNMAQAIQNNKDAKLIWVAMISWDSELQMNAIGGRYSNDTGGQDSDGLPEQGADENPLGLL